MSENTLREVLRSCDPRLKHFRKDARMLRHPHAGGVLLTVEMGFDAMDGDFHTEESKKDAERTVRDILGIWEKIPSGFPAIFHIKVTTRVPALRSPRPVVDTFEACFSNIGPAQKYAEWEYGKAHRVCDEGDAIIGLIEEIIERSHEGDGGPSSLSYSLKDIYLLPDDDDEDDSANREAPRC